MRWGKRGWPRTRGTLEEEIAIYFGAKYPRKLKKRLYGTQRQRRRFTLQFVRAVSRRPVISIRLERIDLEVRGGGRPCTQNASQTGT